MPGSAVSAQLVRGDIEIAATCTVTYIDPKQLLACGHPILQAGPVSLPMTTTEVVTTLASPLDSFKIVNTGKLIGTFTEDRDSGIRGVLGQAPQMIPLHIFVHSPDGDRKLNVEILNLPSLTAQAMLVSLYEALLESNQSSMETSYHLTGSIDLGRETVSPLDEWAAASDSAPLLSNWRCRRGARFANLYSNGARQGAVRGIDLHVEAIPRRMSVELKRRGWFPATLCMPETPSKWKPPFAPGNRQHGTCAFRWCFRPGCKAGNLRILVSDAGTLDRTMDQPRFIGRPADYETILAEAREKHAADRVYVSLLVPETQADVSGRTLDKPAIIGGKRPGTAAQRERCELERRVRSNGRRSFGGRGFERIPGFDGSH